MNDVKDKTQLPSHIEKLQSDFDFVMIDDDLLHESLVLLAHDLCIPLEVIAINFVPTLLPKGTFSDSEQNTVQSMQEAYKFVYNIFIKKLKTRMRQYGEQRMAQDVEKLKSMIKMKHKECSMPSQKLVDGEYVGDSDVQCA